MLAYARFLHLVGVILWIGGTVAAGLIASGAKDEARQGTAIAVRRVILMVVTPGMVLAWLAGLTMLVPGWTTLYARAGWMHGKLTGALVATALTGVITGRIRRAAGGDVGRLGPLRTLALVTLAVAVVVVALAVFQPGG